MTTLEVERMREVFSKSFAAEDIDRDSTTYVRMFLAFVEGAMWMRESLEGGK